MKKLTALTLAAFVAASAATAGGYSEPVVEAMPIVVEESSSSAGALLPLGLLLLFGLAISQKSSGTGA